MPRIIRAFGLALVLYMVFSLTVFAGECEAIRQSVLRLHVLANSNSDEDQSLKLLVRDSVTQYADGIFEKAKNEDEAAAIAHQRLDDIKNIAQQRVYQEGYNYKVDVELAEMYFTTRTYQAVTLPAGTYQALRITIGEARGENWWCVVFPPICLSAATEESEQNIISGVLEEEQTQIVTDSEKYEVKFKIVEFFEGVGNTIKGWFS